MDTRFRVHIPSVLLHENTAPERETPQSCRRFARRARQLDACLGRVEDPTAAAAHLTSDQLVSKERSPSFLSSLMDPNDPIVRL